jgi:lipopolysaccharide cholinephosphotransferase
MLNQFAHFEEIVNLNKQRPWYENVAIKFAQVTQIERSLDPVKIGDRFHRLLKSNRYEDCDEVATFMGAAKMKEIVPKEYYGKGTVYKFEDIDVKCPDKLDYLVHFYGDYMTPPPENERNRHNVTIIGGGGYNPCNGMFLPFAHYSIEGRCA